MLNNRNILVTGGSRGIGLHIVEALAQAGANVSFTYSGSSHLASELEAKYEKVKGYQLQLGTEHEAEQIKAIVKAHKKLDGFVSNAGITDDGFMLLKSEEAWTNVVDVNLIGAYKMTKAIIPLLMKNKGLSSVVFVSSVSGVIGVSGQTNYCTSKFGLIGLTKSLAKELAPMKIRVNSIAPGYIDTDMTLKLPEELRNQYEKNIPLNRFGHSVEVANVVEFLLSEKSSYITAQNIVVDGGLTG